MRSDVHAYRRWCGAVCAILLMAALCCWTCRRAQASDRDDLLSALFAELDRSVQHLQMENHVKPYFIQYTVTDRVSYEFQGQDGALVESSNNRSRPYTVEVRVGSYDEDSGDAHRLPLPAAEKLVVEDDAAAIRHDLWLATDASYRQALQALAYKKTQPKPKTTHHVPDFSVAPPVRCLEPLRPLKVDVAYWEGAVRRLSAIGLDYAPILRLDTTAEFTVSNRYVLNSEGTAVRQSIPLAVISVEVDCNATDGTPLRQTLAFSAREVADLPAMAEMSHQIRALCEEMVALSKAPTLSEDYLGPALFVGPAAGELFGEVLVPLVCNDSMDKLHKPVLPISVNVKDDPLQETLGKLSLLGAYSVDDEGVTAQSVSLIDHGVLANLLSSRKPTKDTKVSNGHGRTLMAGRFGVLPANMLISSADGKPYDELKSQLLERCRQEGLAYGIIVRAPGGPDQFTAMHGGLPTLYYRVAVTSGKEELIRGVRRENVNLRGLKRLVALGSDRVAINYILGPTLAVTIVSPSLLLGELEVTPEVKPDVSPPPEQPVIPRPPMQKVHK